MFLRVVLLCSFLCQIIPLVCTVIPRLTIIYLLVLFAFSQAANRQALEQNFCHAERAVYIRARNAVITARVAIPTAMYQTLSFWVRVMLFLSQHSSYRFKGRMGLDLVSYIEILTVHNTKR